MKKVSFVDFCSGIGAGRLGLELAGFKCLTHSEINEAADRTYQVFFNDHKNLGDLTCLNYSQIPNCDLLIAGFPCQTFSIVGKRAGLKDARGQIIFYLTKIFKAKNIAYFILENVKGLQNHNQGKTLARIKNLLESTGYRVFTQVLNSIDFGVPQSRERLYFVGVRSDLYKGEFSFPRPQAKVSIADFLLESNPNKKNLNDPTFRNYLNNKYNCNRFNLADLLKQDYLILDTRQSDLRLYQNECPTLRTGRHGILYVRGGQLFNLSGLEALLLQGFPMEYVIKAKAINNRLLLSQAGNAMTVNVIRAIGKSLLDYIFA